MSLAEFNGNPYLSLRLFFRGKDGNFYPTQKGCSVRLGEAEGVAKALLEGLRMADSPGGGR